MWTIEDAGNKNNIYSIDNKGHFVKDIDIDNASNIDWEDLISNQEGDLYIGDFGNNSKNRDDFIIYKISNFESDETLAKRIRFTLPEKMKSKDFEAFFVFEGSFYLFSKDNKYTVLMKVPNRIEKHTAELITEYKMKGKRTKITSASVNLSST